MKKALAFVLALAMITVVFSGCNSKRESDSEKDDLITVVVDKEYVDDFALDYVQSSWENKDGSVVYKFEPGEYEGFLVEYHMAVTEECKALIETPCQSTHFNLNVPEIKIGIEDGVYEEYGESVLMDEAQKIGEHAMKYQMNTQEPIATVSVIYRNADSGNVYFEYVVQV